MIIEIAVRVAPNPMADLEDWVSFKVTPASFASELGQLFVMSQLIQYVKEAEHYAETGQYPEVDGKRIKR